MMKFRSLISGAVFCFVLLLNTGGAEASGDVGCRSTMKVFFKGFTGCDSMGFIAPGNDTRINLVFLMSDQAHQNLPKVAPKPEAYPQPSTFTPADWPGFSASLGAIDEVSDGSTSGEGTICVSAAKGAADFLAAVASDKDITDAEKAKLKAAREDLRCYTEASSNASAPGPALDLQSPNAKDFAAYLTAITKFYGTDHTDVSGFAALDNSSQPWVREAARYMEARVTLLSAQAQAFTDYGTLEKDKIDPVKVTSARERLEAYLKAYPQGAYAASATGLLRRAAWLGGDASAQLAAYSKLLAKAEVNTASISLINELDLKLPAEAYPKDGADPVFLAVEDLRQMRLQLDDKGNPKEGMAAAVIEAQKPVFLGHEDLYDYLLSARAWFIDNDAQAVLKILPATAPTQELTYIEFSRQLLRAAAMDGSGDKAADAAYLAMLPFVKQPFQRSTLELALAMSWERHKNIAAVFAPGSPITAPEIRNQVLDYIAGPILLRQQATAKDVPQTERDTALYRLFTRDLVQGHFKGFLDDIALLPPPPAPDAKGNVVDSFAPFRWEGSKTGYDCPDLVTVVKKLQVQAGDVQARLCLGDFFLETDVSDIAPADKDALGGNGTLFAGAVLARHDFYTDIMKSPKATREDKAYALFRAVHC